MRLRCGFSSGLTSAVAWSVAPSAVLVWAIFGHPTSDLGAGQALETEREQGQTGEDEGRSEHRDGAGPLTQDEEAERHRGDRLGERESGCLARPDPAEALGEQDVLERCRDRSQVHGEGQAVGTEELT